MAEMVKTRVNGEYSIILPKHRADREEWYTEKGWEKERLNSMMLHLTKRDTIFYVGAEEGEFPALIQMYTKAKVVLFEPNPKVWPNIKAIYDANLLEMPLALFAGCASDVSKPAENPITTLHNYNVANLWPLCADYEVVGNHGFKELDKEADTFDQTTLDDFSMQRDIIPTALSIDVEGSEGKVLRGAEKIIRRFHPKIWLSLHPEFLLTQYGEWGRELRNWIVNLGYKEELLDYDHEVHLYYHV